MKKFLAIFLGSTSRNSEWEKLDKKTQDEMAQRGMDAWGKWVEANTASIVDLGTPLGRTKKADKNGISDTKNAIAAYTVVQAESHEAAAKLFENHPHFSIFPGDSVEIMECLPIPTK